MTGDNTLTGTAPPRTTSQSEKDYWAARLVAIAERQDREAFHEIFDHFGPRIQGWLVKTGASPAEAEELIQEAMIKVWQRAKQFNPAKASASSWLFAIARNQRIDVIRKQNVRSRATDAFALEYPLHTEQGESPDDGVLGEDRRRRLESGMKKLPPEQASIVELAFFDGLSHRQIAARLSLPIGTVKSRIRLAFARLKNELVEAEL